MDQVFAADGSFLKEVKNLGWFKKYTTKHQVDYLEFRIYPETLQKSTGYEGNFVAKFKDGIAFESSFPCIDSCKRVISRMRNLSGLTIRVTEPNMKPRYECLVENWDATVYTVIQNMIGSMPSDCEPVSTTSLSHARQCMVAEADNFRFEGTYYVYGNSKDGYSIQDKNTSAEYVIELHETDFESWLMDGNKEENLS